ncbi:hypothetical protein DC415_08810 [Agrobacterium tumefaciens]|uniref:Rad50/SbcC-type AAA domain-containing protein n=1 Tax=Rhizobium rhizogenes TaxID=359 RepID=A0AA92C301_RHIRH|nr:hypothetical protein DC430_12195 [Rhizobium rhizogenes]PVE66497.1 hypothetical protein DC415_08810 [Agrobacterium tumefaciens]PVE76485.1 hypothetical protein DCP16_08810 [Sphingomonas sp. TPD3009]
MWGQLVINFPIFSSLEIKNYQLYPGLDGTGNIDLTLSAGPWVVLGVNGLGKSTLLLMLKHAFTGPVRMRGAGFTGDRADIQAVDNRMFAVRVGDGADKGTVTAAARFGRKLLTVSRSLKDLGLLEAKITDGTELAIILTEHEYRVALARLMGLGRFEDVLRTLDLVTFFLESREQLLWNVAGQFEVFRALLSPNSSAEMRKAEGQIVSADSSARNLNTTLFKMMKRRDTERSKLVKSLETRAWLAKATAELESAQSEEGEIHRRTERLREEVSDLRLRSNRADLQVSRYTEAYEELKFRTIKKAFSDVGTNEQYMLLKILADRVCPSCGSPADHVAAELESRLAAHECLICGAPSTDPEGDTGISGEIVAHAFSDLIDARAGHANLDLQLNTVSKLLLEQETSLERKRQEVDGLSREVRKWRSKLPTEDANDAAREEDRIEALRREVANFRLERDEAEATISNLLQTLKLSAEQIREKLEGHFNHYAEVFFAEKVRLVYAPRKATIGQQGKTFEFPAFEVEMTSSATDSNYIRRTANQVSLSQREYLDIIFRMSLIETFSEGNGSLVVDGPEGSVDAVFAEKAGELFSGLAERTAGTTIILACNIVEGAFIPYALKQYTTPELRQERLINLIDIAVPTAALRELHNEYKAAVDRIIATSAA